MTTMTRKEFAALQREWNQKLKAAGFEDIEKWDSVAVKSKQQIQFIKGHIRWSVYKTKANYLTQASDKFEYYRVLGLFGHHGPCKPRYKEILIEAAVTGCITQAIKNIDSKVNLYVVLRYINKNFPIMLEFVNSMDAEVDEVNELEEEGYDRRYN